MAVTIPVFADDRANQSLENLRAELNVWDSITVSEILFPGCTGPFTRSFEINLVTKKVSIVSESAFGKTSKTESPLNLSIEEIERIKGEILLHFERAITEDSINERMNAAMAAKDLDTLKKLNKEHPMPIGGHPALFVQIKVHRDGLDFAYSDQLGAAESCEAFSKWISEITENASGKSGAN